MKRKPSMEGKKFRYSISKNRVWKDLVEIKYNLVVNSICVYQGTSKKDCEAWIKNNGKVATI